MIVVHVPELTPPAPSLLDFKGLLLILNFDHQKKITFSLTFKYIYNLNQNRISNSGHIKPNTKTTLQPLTTRNASEADALSIQFTQFISIYPYINNEKITANRSVG